MEPLTAAEAAEAADTVPLDAYGLKDKQLHEHLSAMFDKLDLEGVRDAAAAAKAAKAAPRAPLRAPRLPIQL